MTIAKSIDHTGYTEPAEMAKVRASWPRDAAAHDALAAAKQVAPTLSRTELCRVLAPLGEAATAAVLADFDALTRVRAEYLNALAYHAWQEACLHDQSLRYPLVRLADDVYVPWSGNGDAPVGNVMTAQEARDAGFPAERIRDARTVNADGQLYNRAGPGEKPLTVAAIIEAYASDAAYAAFRLSPDKIAPYTTSEMCQDPQTGEWQESAPFWTPWAPGEAPEALPDGWRDRF